MEKIIFLPEDHEYIRESDGMNLMSVSHFRKLFDSTDWEHNIRKSAAQDYLKATLYKKYKTVWEEKGRHILDPEFITYLLKYMDKTTFERVCEEVRATWRAAGDEGAAKGTIGHAAEEEETIRTGMCINPYNGLEYPTQPHGKMADGGNSTTVERLCDLEPGFYPELLLWHFFPEPIHSQSLGKDICGIAGQSDRVFIEPSASFVGDHKFTGKPLSDFPTFYTNYGHQVLDYPFDSWKIHKLSGYKIQLNMYGWMLDQHGLPPVDLRIHNNVLKTGAKQEFVFDYYPETISEAVDMAFLESL